MSSTAPGLSESRLTKSTSLMLHAENPVPSAAMVGMSRTLKQAIENNELWVCIDLEAHCRNQSYKEYLAGITTNEGRICEVGIDIIDTAEINQIDIGDRAQNLMQYHRPHDFAIREAFHNPKKFKSHKSWCKAGCPRDFLFGRYERISESRVRDSILNVIKQHMGFMERSIVFFFYDKNNDMKGLAEYGVLLREEFPASRVVDIQKCRVATTIRRQLGAQDLYYYLGLPTKKEHNGNNDAVFEMQAYLAGLALEEEHFDILSSGRALTPALSKLWEVLSHLRVPRSRTYLHPRNSVHTPRLVIESIDEFPLFPTTDHL